MTQRTLIIYSGPTSTNRTFDKNGMYIDNMNYFLEHGVDCPKAAQHSGFNGGASVEGEGDEEAPAIQYVFVLTQQVADYYQATGGKITQKRNECSQLLNSQYSSEEYIKVIIRQDRCYDMESMRIVIENKEMDVQKNFDNLLFVNCGLVGPKFGLGSPKYIPSSNNKMIPYQHWSQIYTSRLNPTLRLVGHSINTHFHTYFPHVQSFLYALTPDTAQLLLSQGAIYDCGLTQSELSQDPARRFELIQRYEVGMSTTLLKMGYSISSAFINRWNFGTPLVLNQNSTQGRELDDTISDIWYEDGVRNLTRTTDKTLRWWPTVSIEDHSNFRKRENTFEYHQWDILPWEYYLFFKVSRLVPKDIQDEMQYSNLDLVDVDVIPNDPRDSPNQLWQTKTREFDGAGHVRIWQFLLMILIPLFVVYSKRKQIYLQLRYLKKQTIARSGRDD